MRWAATNYNEWHPHFTWLPEKINNEWVWLERVLRRGRGRIQSTSRDGKWNWEYVNSEFDVIKLEHDRIGKMDRAENKTSSAEQAAMMPPSYRP